MTVRTTGGSPAPPRRSTDPFGPSQQITAPPPSGDAGSVAMAGPVVLPGPTTAGEAAVGDESIGQSATVGASAAHRETRREVRAARRRRRQLMVVCAAVIAVCLALTILVVSMARQRPSGLPAAVASVGAVTGVAGPTLPVSRPFSNLGADAPLGGHH